MDIVNKISDLLKKLREKRAFDRKKAHFPVHIKLESIDEFIDEYITDISAGGVFIATQNPYERGSVVDLEFSIQGEAKHFFKVRGVVVRVHDGSDNDPTSPHTIKGMGIKFIEITEQSRDLLKALLEKLGKENLTVH